MNAEVMERDPKLVTIDRFFAAYADNDLETIAGILAPDVEWTIPGHHPLAGTKHGVEEVVEFFRRLDQVGFRPDPIFLGTSEEYVVASTAAGRPPAREASTRCGHSSGISRPRESSTASST